MAAATPPTPAATHERLIETRFVGEAQVAIGKTFQRRDFLRVDSATVLPRAAED